MLTHDEIAYVMRHGTGPQKMAIRWQYMSQGSDSFIDKLLQAAAHADQDNLVLLSLGFPDVAAAIELWRNIPGWAQGLKDYARMGAALNRSLPATPAPSSSSPRDDGSPQQTPPDTSAHQS